MHIEHDRVRKKQVHAGSDRLRTLKAKRATYRTVGRLYRPPDLQTQSAKSEQEEEPAALGLFSLLFALPVIVVHG